MHTDAGASSGSFQKPQPGSGKSASLGALLAELNDARHGGLLSVNEYTAAKADLLAAFTSGIAGGVASAPPTGGVRSSYLSVAEALAEAGPGDGAEPPKDLLPPLPFASCSPPSAAEGTALELRGGALVHAPSKPEATFGWRSSPPPPPAAAALPSSSYGRLYGDMEQAPPGGVPGGQEGGGSEISKEAVLEVRSGPLAALVVRSSTKLRGAVRVLRSP